MLLFFAIFKRIAGWQVSTELFDSECIIAYWHNNFSVHTSCLQRCPLYTQIHTQTHKQTKINKKVSLITVHWGNQLKISSEKARNHTIELCPIKIYFAPKIVYFLGISHKSHWEYTNFSLENIALSKKKFVFILKFVFFLFSFVFARASFLPFINFGTSMRCVTLTINDQTI